jgi:hypothetical protein
VGLLGLRASCGVFFGRFLWLGLRLFWVFFFFFLVLVRCFMLYTSCVRRGTLRFL